MYRVTDSFILALSMAKSTKKVLKPQYIFLQFSQFIDFIHLKLINFSSLYFSRIHLASSIIHKSIQDIFALPKQLFARWTGDLSFIRHNKELP